MSLSSRKDYLNRLRLRYAQSGKMARKSILDECCATAGYTRKYAIKLLTGNRKHRRCGGLKRECKYALIREELKTIWLAANQLCGKRLKPALSIWLSFYEKHHMRLSPEQRELLTCISASQIDRELSHFKLSHSSKRRLTKPGTLLKKKIPYACDHQNWVDIGYLETDTVAHCGTNLMGNFLWSLTFTCPVSGWTENACMYRRSKSKTVEYFDQIRKRLPFKVSTIDFDNGTEYINDSFVSYCEKEGIKMLRSRPYQKNDNAHVEQRNWTHVRELLGYDRLADPEQEHQINELYQNYWSPYQNYFCPTMKLIRKRKEGGKWKKHYDEAQTPYHRLLKSGQLSKEETQRLEFTYTSLDPFELKKNIENKLREIFNPEKNLLVRASPNKKIAA